MKLTSRDTNKSFRSVGRDRNIIQATGRSTRTLTKKPNHTHRKEMHGGINETNTDGLTIKGKRMISIIQRRVDRQNTSAAKQRLNEAGWPMTLLKMVRIKVKSRLEKGKLTNLANDKERLDAARRKKKPST